MKKAMLALGVIAFFSLASCKKDYTCECTMNGQKQSTPLNDQKKSDAEDACNALDTQLGSSGSCELK